MLQPNSLTPFTAILFASAALCYLSACGSPPMRIPPGSPLGVHLAPAWIASAARRQSDQYTVYYRGIATAGAGSRPGAWLGTITGDILLLRQTEATVCPSGTVTLGPGSRLSIRGPSQIHLSAGPPVPWQTLLPH